jgi:site-specific recombinase XerD
VLLGNEDLAEADMRELHEVNRRVWVAYTRHLQILRRSEETIKTYFEAVYNIDSFFGSDLTSLTRFDVQDYLASRTETMKPKSVRTYFLALRTFYKWMLAEELITKNPFDRVDVPQVPEVQAPVLTDQTIKAILATCNTRSFLDLRDQAIIRLMVEPGGPRRMEVTGLLLENVDEENALIKLHGKGNKTRFMPFGAKTGQALFRYLNLRAKHKYADLPELWIGKYGALGKKAVGQMLERRCIRAGVPKINPHLLRHVAADRAMAAGISDLDMQTLFGWSTPAMLRIYASSNRTQRAITSARAKALGDRY